MIDTLITGIAESDTDSVLEFLNEEIAKTRAGASEGSFGDALYQASLLALTGLASMSKITGGKADIAFLLSLTGSYMLGRVGGELPEDVDSPVLIFDRDVKPQLDAMEDGDGA